MGVSVGAINNSKNQLITSCSSGEPNWSFIPSAFKTNKTEAEFVTEIKDLARKAATATSTAERDAIDRKVLQLRTEYLSDVAPDRKSLYQSAQNAMSRNNGSNTKCRGIGELTLLDFLEQAEGHGSLAEKQFALAGVGILTCPILTTGGYGAVIECQGVKVISNAGNGWNYEMTPAELAKKKQFYAVYWSEYRSVKGNSELAELPDYLEEHNVFDAKA